jgi:hypothetical protein
MYSKFGSLITKYIGEICSACLGFLFVWYFWGSILDPTYVDWILTSGHDLFQHYVGWLFFRNSPQTFPIGVIKDLGYPIGAPISYTDSLPLFAFLLKPISFLLPSQFQYFGFWIALSFMLQGVLGYKISQLIFKSKLTSVLGSLFFIVSPIAIFRVAGHFSLASHWLILWSIYVVVSYRSQFPKWLWLIILIISLLVHPFFVIINGAIMTAHTVELVCRQKLKLKKSIVYYFLQIAVISLISYVIGLFYIGDTGGGGFGRYSMNLNSLYNPYWGKWSTILVNRHTGRFQYEGFSYLGVGMMMLLVLALISFVKNKSLFFVKKQIKYWPYYLLGTIFTLLAVSTKVMWGKSVIFEISTGQGFINDLLGLIRSSGRLFWPVYYGIVIFALWGLRKYRTTLAIVTLLAVFSLQMYDFSYHLQHREKDKFSKKRWKLSLPEYWSKVGNDYQHIKFIPTYPQGPLPKTKYVDIMMYAAKNDMTVNMAYFSRSIKGNGSHIYQEVNQLKQGNISDDSIYVILPQKKELTNNLKINQRDLIKKKKDYTIFIPKFYSPSE